MAADNDIEGIGLAGHALADPVLLQKIDRLFACNVGEHVSLPQVVVVGDQSSGKSSVLEGLTKVNFPRDSGLSTRFVTQIIFRRDLTLTARNIVASIIPSSDESAEDEQRLRNWKFSGLQSLDPKQFTQLMKEVHIVMGLSVADGHSKVFSSSVLQIEICGPAESHLTVIDVPGIFKNTTSGRTTKKDIELVRNLALGYMQNPRSIILAVVPANVDVATQEIIEMAHDADPEELRTLKILTKPDLVDWGVEKSVVKLINDGSLNGQPAWILVRNLSQREIKDGNTDRDHAEACFHQIVPWNQVSTDNYGIEALKARLQELLTANVRREFPMVRDEIVKELREAKTALDSLGDHRDTSKQQRRVLLGIVSAFQEIKTHAIVADYGAHSIFNEESARLVTLIHRRNALFSYILASHGHTWAFDSKKSNPLACTIGSNEAAMAEHSHGSHPQKSNMIEEKVTVADSGGSNSKGKKRSRRSKWSRRVEGPTDIQEILDDRVKFLPPQRFVIFDCIKLIYENSRGFEIGTYNPTLLSTLMKRQSERWPAVARGYISDVISHVHTFICTVLHEVCKNSEISDRIISILRDKMMQRYRRAIESVDFLVGIEMNGTPLTMNHYFNDTLEKCRQKRFQDDIAPNVIEDAWHGQVVRLSDLATQHHMSNTDHTVRDIHDILRSYYKVALKRFVDNVCMQAANHHLLTGAESAINLITTTWVSDLSNQDLEAIAGEEMGSKRRRRQLEKKIEDLEAGMKILSS